MNNIIANQTEDKYGLRDELKDAAMRLYNFCEYSGS